MFFKFLIRSLLEQSFNFFLFEFIKFSKMFGLSASQISFWEKNLRLSTWEMYEFLEENVRFSCNKNPEEDLLKVVTRTSESWLFTE